MKRHRLILRSLLIVAFSYCMYSCAVNPVSGKKELSLMSEEKEIQMGKQYDPSIVASMGLYDDPEIQAFIEEKGKEMAAISHRPNLPYEFKVVDSPVINAFAVPGGFVYFTRGILAHFSNEAEFAGVLGHEIGHITAKHGVRQQATQLLSQIGLIGGVILTKGQGAQELSQAMGLLNLKYGRNHESESDKLGVEYSTKIGYDAEKMANFFFTLNRMREQAGVSVPTFQSTHPDPLDRYQKVKDMSQKAQAELGLTNPEVGRDRYLRMIDGLMYGEDPQQGYVEDDFFYHPGLKFKFPVPREWRTANSPQQFQMGDKDGKAMMLLTLGKDSPQASLTAFNEQAKLQATNTQNVRVNGLLAVRQEAKPAPQQAQQGQQQQQQQDVRILSYAIQYGSNVFMIHGVAAAADYPNFQRTFEYTMTRFDELRDPAKINRVADEIKIEEVRRAGTLDQVLRYFNMPTDRLEEIALVNSMKLTDQISTGMLIKTIVNNGQYKAGQSTKTTPSTTNSNTRPSTPSTTKTPSTNTNKIPSTNKAPSTTKTPSTNKIPTRTPSTTKKSTTPSTTTKPSTTGKKKIGTIKKKN
ncbi:MAG: M48 family metalloprotease [Saprospiraceae bacterium]